MKIAAVVLGFAMGVAASVQEARAEAYGDPGGLQLLWTTTGTAGAGWRARGPDPMLIKRENGILLASAATAAVDAACTQAEHGAKSPVQRQQLVPVR